MAKLWQVNEESVNWVTATLGIFSLWAHQVYIIIYIIITKVFYSHLGSTRGQGRLFIIIVYLKIPRNKSWFAIKPSVAPLGMLTLLPCRATLNATQVLKEDQNVHTQVSFTINRGSVLIHDIFFTLKCNWWYHVLQLMLKRNLRLDTALTNWL